jgi:hypothetical protein
VTDQRSVPRVAVIGIVISLILAVGVSVLRTVNAEPVERTAEIAGTIAFAAVFAAPAFLASLGLRGRPPLFFAAGALEMVLAFMTLISLIGLVFVIPGVMFFMAGGRTNDASAGPLRSIAAVVVSVVLGTAGFFALFAREDPIWWARNPATGESFRLDAATFVHGSTITMDSRDLPAGATESGCSSDSISTVEAMASLVIVATMLGAAWVLTKPSGGPVRVQPAAVTQASDG